MLLPKGPGGAANKSGYQTIDNDERSCGESSEVDHIPDASVNQGAQKILSCSSLTKWKVNVPKRVLVVFTMIVFMTVVLAFLAGFFTDQVMKSSGMLRATVVHPDMRNYDMVMHISDTHIDPYFDPTMSMMPGVCHPCNMSTDVFGKDTWCPHPTQLPPTPEYDMELAKAEMAFGRYGCNPPYRLWHSLHHHMHKMDPDPKVVIFTGDISPHGYPDDDAHLKKDTLDSDLCDTKFLVTKMMVQELVEHFPNTKWAYTLGNIDHFPKDDYWRPYMKKYADMLLETKFFTQDQYDQFILYGSNYIDIDNVRYLSIDMTLFMKNGEVSFGDEDPEQTVRHKVVEWLKKTLQNARELNLHVYLVGHQPLQTKRGKDELDVNNDDFQRLKDVLMDFADVIRVGFFGHRNLAGIFEVLSPAFLPVFPAITAPGVSPRGKNQPSFHVLYKDKETGIIQDFEQWYFNLLQENHIAKDQDITYMGTWKRHEGALFSWRTLSKENEFTQETLERFLNKIPHNQRDFLAIEEWRTAGYIGDETPISYKCKSLYDENDMMMKCLFPNQDKRCWSTDWLS